MNPYAAMWITFLHLIATICNAESWTSQEPGPPIIVAEPEKRIAYREGESFELPCIASGQPEPSYHWTKNNVRWDPDDINATLRPGSGTIVFRNPRQNDEGIYQCFASNSFGTSVSIYVELRMAYLESFDMGPVRTLQPKMGYPAFFTCNPPSSFPSPAIFWAVIVPGLGFSPVDLTDRITMDHEGNLYFAHVQAIDSQNDKRYACMVQNHVMRAIQQGSLHSLQPQGPYIQGRIPFLLWHSPVNQTVLRFETWRSKCIFSGSPTPRVDWYWQHRNIPSRGRTESFGQELVIEQIQYEDEGEYVCQGINDEAQLPTSQMFYLNIQSKPIWLVRPTSQYIIEGSDVVFECRAESIPSPSYQWFINGATVEGTEGNSQIIVEENYLTIRNISRYNTSVIQCNATNVHGYIFENARLTYREPEFVPPTNQKAAEGQTVNMTCSINGILNPTISWTKYGNEIEFDDRIYLFDDGTLHIRNLSLNDNGNYTCSAELPLGVQTASAILIVRERTRITEGPKDTTVQEYTDIQLRCMATTDPLENDNLTIRWERNIIKIDFRSLRFSQSEFDNSLIIRGAIPRDTALYTCVADNGIDSAESSAYILVKGVPDPPYYVRVSCGIATAVVEWHPPWRDGNSPITGFVVQFNTSFNQDIWTDMIDDIPRNQTSVEVELSPWCNYTFRVLARNAVGLSYPSWHTTTVCTTYPDVPYKNPSNVIVEGDSPGNLIIYWTPMPLIDQNGEGFKYIIQFQRADIPDSPMNYFVVDDSKTWHQVFSVDFVSPYTPFEASVRAQNALGDCIVPPEIVLGYSGEDVPVLVPLNVSVIESSITGTSAELIWTDMDISPQTIRGYFRGFRIEFATLADWPRRIRHQDILINEPVYYPPLRTKREFNYNGATVHGLPPISEVVVQVRVLNKYYAGHASNKIIFTTLEGVPGPPAMLDILSTGPNHLEISWDQPRDPNGILTGYVLYYHKVEGLTLGQFNENITISNSSVAHTNVTELDASSRYRIYLAASTALGIGETIFIEEATDQEEEICVKEKAACQQMFIPTLETVISNENNCSVGFYLDYVIYQENATNFKNIHDCTTEYSDACMIDTDIITWCVDNVETFDCMCVSESNDTVEYYYKEEHCDDLFSNDDHDEHTCDDIPIAVWRTCLCGYEDESSEDTTETIDGETDNPDHETSAATFLNSCSLLMTIVVIRLFH